MRKIALFLFIFTVVLVSHGDAVAGVSDAAVLFLRIAAGARAAGMGEAFVAVADDATATHWNPAGLGSYPLASEFHELKVVDDKTMREKASKVLKGDVEEDYSETVGRFLFSKSGIVHISEAGDERYIEYEVDSDIPMVQYIAANAVMDDRDLLKIGVRAIAYENTGVTFEQINSHRERLVVYLDNSQIGEVNRLFEMIVADWQNLKIVPESITFLEERLNFILQDDQLTPEEYSQVIETLTNATRKSRSRNVKIPYSVLLALWKDYSLPWETKIIDMVLLKNDVPENNYRHFDIWALTPSGIIRWDRISAWKSSLEAVPKKRDKLPGLIAAYTGVTDEDRLASLMTQVASSNYGISKGQVEEMVATIEANFTDDYVATEMFNTDLSEFVNRFQDMTLDPDRFSAFVESYQNAMGDGTLAKEELERLEFALHGAHVGYLPVTVHLAYSLTFGSEPTCLAATEKLLWVGTDDGLYLFNGRAWQRYTTEDGLPSNKINALSVFDKNRLWAATGKGVAYYYKGKWTTYPAETGLEQIEFTQVYGYSREKAWAAAENKLFFFNGTTWRSDFTYTAVVNDTLSRIVREFTGVYDYQYIGEAVKEIKAKNGLQTDYPEAGTEIMIPFEYAFRHPITSMLYNNNSKNLWVGTTHGLKIFADGRFKVFGYKKYTASEDMTLTEAVQDFDGEAGSSKVEQLAALIKSYNYIEGDGISANQTVYVYANPLGSHIYSMVSTGDDIFVATNFGTVKYSGETFSRYYHNNLEREKTVSIRSSAGDVWYATPQKVVIYAHAKTEITLMHAKWLPELAPDLYFEYISYVHHLGDEWGTIGLNATFLSYGDIARTTEFSSAVIDTFHSFDGALALTYGATVSRNLAVGVTAKVIYSRLAEQGAGAELGEGNATAFAVDVGVLYRTPFKKLTLGAALTNLGPNVAYIDAAQSDTLPRNLAVGLAYDLFKNPYNKLTLVGEVNKMLTDLDDGFSEEMKEAIENVGFEYWYGSFIALRAGYVNDDVGQVNTFTVGAGLQYRQLRFDFAYIPSSETVPLANTLRVSLTGRL